MTEPQPPLSSPPCAAVVVAAVVFAPPPEGAVVAAPPTGVVVVLLVVGVLVVVVRETGLMPVTGAGVVMAVSVYLLAASEAVAAACSVSFADHRR